MTGAHGRELASVSSVTARASDATEDDLVSAAGAGDEQAFHRLVDPYRYEVQVHCYRMLGSFHDAEDATQDALLRAWRLLHTFAGRSTFRAWLYRIATNVCLTALARRRDVPVAEPPAGLPQGEPTVVLHLSPLPGPPEQHSGEPDLHYLRREAVELAFVAAVQLLPPRQRAVLAMRDVLGFSAQEVADQLDTTVAGVNSSLQRARASVARAQQQPALAHPHRPSSPAAERAAVRAFVDAWQRADVPALVSLLTRDAVLAMPPMPLRFVGPELIGAFFRTAVPGGDIGRIHLLETRANQAPALAAYVPAPDGGHVLYGVMVLAVSGERIASISAFPEPAQYGVLDLPSTWPTTRKVRGS